MSNMYEGHILFAALNLEGGRSLTLIVIDVFCPKITHLDWTVTHLRRTILS
jgi:hypothetical protein